MATENEEKDFFIVAAIDLGTTFSGYAYSFRHDYKSNPLTIHSNFWKGSYEGKIPTALLLTKNGTFHSFGFDAEDNYNRLTESDDHKGWRFFKKFKMELLKEGLNKTTVVKDEDGNPFLAIDVLRHSICFFKDHLLDVLKNKSPDVKKDDIKWVVTVPAIWTESAKQFMRIAAKKAGIDDGNLSLALEPEAASIFCKLIPIERMTETCGRKDILVSFQPGYTYLIADLGGGTTDITVHRVRSDYNLEEIHRPSGGPWGGAKVDECFLSFLSELFGATNIEDFRKKFKNDFIELMRNFENKKGEIGVVTKPNDIPRKFNLPLPQTLKDILQSKNIKSFEDALDRSQFKNKHKVTVKFGKLILEKGVTEGFFEEIVTEIGNYIEGIFRDPRCSDIKMILLVGGFADSPLVRHSIRQRFPKVRTIVPHEAGRSVLKGAVVFGQNPNIVQERVCPLTYGTCFHVPLLKGHTRKRKKS
ncbi:hypothetical protein ScPMuIL_010724 [Solemya velum]